MISNKSNNNSAFTIVIVLLVLVAISMIIFGTRIKISNDEIKLVGIFKTTIKIKDVKEIKLINDISKGIRIFGLSFGPFDIGTYSYKDIGKTNVYITSNELPYLLIQDSKKSILIGNGREKNQDIYNTIVKAMERD